MNRIFNYLGSQISSFRFAKLDDKLVVPTDNKKRISYQMKHEKVYKFDVEQDDLKTAILRATDIHDARRDLLTIVYEEALRDADLLTNTQNAVDDVLAQGGGLYPRGSEERDDDLSKLLERTWNMELSGSYVRHEWQGSKVMEFGQLIAADTGWEIESIKEIPMDHVLFDRGLLIAHPQASSGLPYRPRDWGHDPRKRKIAEACSEWLIEIGKPDHLGTLAVAAKYAIYNKWALGDWAKSLDKWLDPTLVIQSAQDDDRENEKKEKAAKNFGNNSYMIADGDDKIHLLQRDARGFQINKEFLEYLDKKAGLIINGQNATSQEQAWTGTSEVQERTQLKRSITRLRYKRAWTNEILIPKLISLNGGDTAYKALKGYTWNNPLLIALDNDTRIKDLLEGSETGKKAEKEKSGGTSEKKPKNPVNRKTLSYSTIDRLTQLYPEASRHNHGQPENKKKLDLEGLAEEVAKLLHGQKIKRGNIDLNITKAQAEQWVEAITDGSASLINDVPFASAEHRLLIQLRYNVHVAAAFKSHKHALAVHDLLFHDNGKLKPRSLFLKDIKKINRDYYRHWATSEYNLAKAKARMADRWKKYEAKGGSLVYQGVLDQRIRPQHKELHGAIYPVDDEFWNTYFPPNGWGCRCSVRRITERKTVPPREETELDEIFQTNPGKTGRVFEKGHPYFEVAKEFEQKAKNLFGYIPPVDLQRFQKNLALFETLKDDSDYVLKSVHKETGGFISAHKNYDVSRYQRNQGALSQMGEKGYSVQVRQRMDGDKRLIPAVVVDGKLTDIKYPEDLKGVQNAFKNASEEGLKHVVIQGKSSWSLKDLSTYLDNGFHFNKKIESVWLLRGDSLFELTRKQWKEGKTWVIR